MFPLALIVSIALGSLAPSNPAHFKPISADYSQLHLPPLFKISLTDYTVDFEAQIRSKHFFEIKIIKAPPQIADWVENSIRTISVDQRDSVQPKSFRIKLRGSSTPKLFEKTPL